MRFFCGFIIVLNNTRNPNHRRMPDSFQNRKSTRGDLDTFLCFSSVSLAQYEETREALSISAATARATRALAVFVNTGANVTRMYIDFRASIGANNKARARVYRVPSLNEKVKSRLDAVTLHSASPLAGRIREHRGAVQLLCVCVFMRRTKERNARSRMCVQWPPQRIDSLNVRNRQLFNNSMSTCGGRDSDTARHRINSRLFFFFLSFVRLFGLAVLRFLPWKCFCRYATLSAFDMHIKYMCSMSTFIYYI